MRLQAQKDDFAQPSTCDQSRRDVVSPGQDRNPLLPRSLHVNSAARSLFARGKCNAKITAKMNCVSYYLDGVPFQSRERQKLEIVFMKPRILLAFICALISTLAHAETFIGPTSATNRLLVPTNSAIIITTTLGDFTNSTQVVLQGYQFTQSYFAPLESGNSYALAGPAELIFTNPVAITFYRIMNAAIRSQGIGNDPIGILIPTNKTMRLFGVPAPVNAAFWRPGVGSVSFTLEPNRPAEFTG